MMNLGCGARALVMVAIGAFCGCGVGTATDDEQMPSDTDAGSDDGDNGNDSDAPNGDADDDGSGDAEAQAFRVGGTVTGLAGTGLVLRNNGTDDLAITGNGSFTFPTAISSGASFTVTVASQPDDPAQTCSTTNDTGTVSDQDVTSVVIECFTNTYPVSVTVAGLAAQSQVTLDNNGEALVVSENGTTPFATLLESGATYDVSVVTQPSSPVSQTCTLDGGTGTVGSSAVSLFLGCVTDTFTVSGSVTGLAAGAVLVLRDQGGALVTLEGNGSVMPFAFSTPVASGEPYNVIVHDKPTLPSQTCNVTTSSELIGNADVTDVEVTCVTDYFTVSASVIGMSGGTLVLQNNDTDDVSFTGNDTLAFASQVESGAPYSVTVKTQPAGQSCSIPAGAGTVGASDVTVVVNCGTAYTVGGTVSGLAGSGLVLLLNGDDAKEIAGDGSFTFAAELADETPFEVEVGTQPIDKWQTCVVDNGASAIAGADYTDVSVTCTTNTYAIGGTVTGLAAGGTLVLRNNGGNSLSLTTANTPGGAFAFTSKIASGNTYNVTVHQNPTVPGNGQTCTVTSGGSGTVAGTDITSVQVSCVNNYTVGGAVTGLYGSALTLRLNGDATNSVTVNAPATSYVFPKPLPSGSSYSVTVQAQPVTYHQVCEISSPTGDVASANVTTVDASCGNVSKIEITSTVFKANGITQASPATIPDSPTDNCSLNNPGTPLLGEIAIAENHFSVQSVSVRLNNISHTWLGDLSVSIERDVGTSTPDIRASTSLFDRPGRLSASPDCGSSAALAGTYTFRDDGTANLWSASAPGVYFPTGYGSATAYTYLEELPPNGFFGSLTSGKWRIRLIDNNSGDAGSITSWTLTLEP